MNDESNSGPTEEPLDPRAIAAKLLGYFHPSDEHYAEMDAAATVLNAWAELPESTRRLAHAAATVRARLGEGWRMQWVDESFMAAKGGDVEGPSVIIEHIREDRWRWNAQRVPFTAIDAGYSPSIDAAIAAALTALEPTP